jgi:epoxyqueuosine reductase QueG
VVLSRKIRWGCDTCQDVCPMNKNPAITPISFFHKDIISVLTSEVINSMTDEEFSQRAYSWRGKNTILRNLEHK